MRQQAARSQPGSAEAGSVTIFLAVFFLGFLLLTGLVLDASRALHANAHASDLAAKAARVGAQEIDPVSLRGGAIRLDPADARNAAIEYLARKHVSGDVQANDQLVSVTVRWPIRFRLLAPLRDGIIVTQTRTVAATDGP